MLRFVLALAFCAAAFPALAQETAPDTAPVQEAAPPPAETAPPAPEPVVGPQVKIDTSMGTILLQLDAVHAPISVANFLRYVREGHYDDTLVYRVAPGFVIEAGSYGRDGNGRVLHDPIPLEANNGLKNVRGAVAVARNTEPSTGQAEFFIVLADNPGLDQAPDDQENRTGYAVFGHVAEGMEVVDQIAAVPIGGGKGPFPDEAPQTPIVITNVSVVGDPPRPPPKGPAKAAPKAPAKAAAKKR